MGGVDPIKAFTDLDNAKGDDEVASALEQPRRLLNVPVHFSLSRVQDFIQFCRKLLKYTEQLPRLSRFERHE